MYFIWKLRVWMPFKVLFSPTHTLVPTVFSLLETVLVRFFCDGFSSFVAFALISEIVSNLLPLRVFLSCGNKKKSQGAKSGE